MRYRSALLLVTFLGSALAQQALDGALTIALASDFKVPPNVLAAMQEEVEGVYAPAGVRVAWHDANSKTPEVYERLASIRLRGKCVLGAPFPATMRLIKTDLEALGQTQVVDGMVLPIADVLCDSVRKLIDRDMRSSPAAERNELFGRALGRVMAHELYHILLRTRDHGHDGLARPAQNSVELLAAPNPFAERDERKVSAPASVSAGGSAESDR
jgi:hypothetical protein